MTIFHWKNEIQFTRTGNKEKKIRKMMGIWDLGKTRPGNGLRKWDSSLFPLQDSPLKLSVKVKDLSRSSGTFSCTLLYIAGPYLTAVDLADIATQLDEDERERMAEGDVTSQDYQEFLKVLEPYS